MDPKNQPIMKDVSYDIYQPFGPSVLKTKLPALYVHKINEISDTILSDDKKRKDLDWSDNLAGNIKYEVSFDHNKVKGLPEFFLAMAEQYLLKTLGKKRVPDDTAVGIRSWIVSQYAGDFNPMHIHDANLSGVIFLAMPPDFEEEYAREDHHPTAGCLEFIGAVANHFANHSYLVKPEVGDFYLFPSWLTHQVYPFRSKGERRSMAFNLHLSLKNTKGVDV